ERDNARSAALEEDVGEAAGRGAYVDAVQPRWIDAERVEPVRELLAAARDVLWQAFDLELGVLLHLLARLVVAGDEAREHERLRPRARVGEPALHEEDVEALLHGSLYPASPRSQARSGSHPSTTSTKPSRRAGPSSRLNSSC